MDMGMGTGEKPVLHKIGTPVLSPRSISLSTPLPRYSGFPWWNVLWATPGRECKSAERLQQVSVFAYLPTYTKRRRQRCRNNTLRLYPIVTGMIFVPTDMMEIERREETFEHAGVKILMRASETPFALPKPEIEALRELEARENLATPNRHHSFRVGTVVKLRDEMLAESWGKGTISALAKDGRIRVDIDQLFGRTTHIWISAAEIVAM